MAAILGQRVPTWELPTFLGAPGQHRLEDYAGRIVVLLFWASNPMCKRYQPYLDGLAESYRSRGIAVIAIDPDPTDSPERILLMLDDKLPSFPVLRDAGGSVARAYGVQVIPTVYVIDQEGVLRYWGAIDDRTLEELWPDENYVEEVVERLVLELDIPDPHNPPAGHELHL